MLRCRLWEFYRNQTLMMYFRKSKKKVSTVPFIFNWPYFLNVSAFFSWSVFPIHQEGKDYTWMSCISRFMNNTLLEFLLQCVPAPPPPPSPPHRCNPWWPTIFDLTTTLIYSDIFFEDRPIIISVSISVKDYITLM